MPKKYVMANDAEGRSDVVIDKFVPLEGAFDLWINFNTPADLGSSADPTEGHTFLHEPPRGGAIFRVMTFTRALNDVTPEQMLELHRGLNSEHVPSLEELLAAKHSTMHRTSSLNYFVLLSGRLWMLSEQGDRLLEPGDFVVQQACMHGWRVESEEPAVLACVLIDAKAPNH